jgi:electron transfer flavoprotein alpha subunit
VAVDKVWVYAETDSEKVTTATLELLTKAREIGGTVEAIYAGKNPIDAVAASVGEYGATKL